MSSHTHDIGRKPMDDGSMGRTDLDDVRLLEAEFAEAMTRLYAVGNGLAALRTKLVTERATPPPVMAAGITSAAAAAAPAEPGPGPARPAGAESPLTPAATSLAPAAQPTAAVVAGASVEPGAAPEAKPSTHPTPASAPVKPTWPDPTTGAGPGSTTVESASGRERERPGPESLTPWWQREGMVVRLLGVAGAGVLLIGVVLLLAFAIQHGYLGPVGRVGGAAVLAVALVAVAVRLHRDPRRRAGAVAIAAAGYATAYLDVIAVTAIYGWLPPATGLVIGGLIAASGVILARAWDRQLLALITVGGVAALAPAVTDGRHLLTAGFLVVLAAAAYPAHLGRTWLALHAVRSLPAALALVVAADAEPGRAVFVLAVAFAALELGTALIATRLHTRTALLTPALLATSFPVLTAAHDAGAALWAVASVAAAIHVVVALLAGPVAPPAPPLALAPWAGGLGTGFTVFAAVDGAPERALPTVLLALACVAAAGAQAMGARGGQGRWPEVSAVCLAAVGVTGYLTLIPRVLSEPIAVVTIEPTDVLASLLVVALAAMLPRVLTGALRPAFPSAASPSTAPPPASPGTATPPASPGTATPPASPGTATPPASPAPSPSTAPPATAPATYAQGETVAGTAWTMFASWTLLLAGASTGVISTAVLVGERIGATAGGFVTGHGLATLLWAVAAAYLLMHGLRRSRDATLALRIGLALAGVAVAKLLLFDLAALDGIVRVAAFIGAGLALLAMGAGYARALDRTRVTPGLNRG